MMTATNRISVSRSSLSPVPYSLISVPCPLCPVPSFYPAAGLVRFRTVISVSVPCALCPVPYTLPLWELVH